MRNTGDPYPLTDSDNTTGWVLQEQFSDEFNGTSVDMTKWYDSWNTWKDTLRWTNEAIEVSDGTLKLTISYQPDDSINVDPVGWETRGLANEVTNVRGDDPCSGAAALVHTFPRPYWASTEALVTELDNCEYTLRAWIWSGEGHREARISVSDFDDSGTRLDVPIKPSSGYQLYEIDGIAVNRKQATISFFNDSPAQAWMRIDDVEFCERGSRLNLAPNPGFEERIVVPYQSGILHSIETINQGYFEARIKGPSLNPCAVPAFWLSYQACDRWTEIDIVEGQQFAENPYLVDHNCHVLRHPSLQSGDRMHDRFTWEVPWRSEQDFHVYALDWGADEIIWYVDGKRVRSRNARPYFDQAMSLILSTSVTEPYRSNPTPEGFPTTMEVDYVRVWQK